VLAASMIFLDLTGKLLVVLVDLRGQSAQFIRAHVRHKRRVDCP
jgi:hypothetical protein